MSVQEHGLEVDLLAAFEFCLFLILELEGLSVVEFREISGRYRDADAVIRGIHQRAVHAELADVARSVRREDVHHVITDLAACGEGDIVHVGGGIFFKSAPLFCKSPALVYLPYPCEPLLELLYGGVICHSAHIRVYILVLRGGESPREQRGVVRIPPSLLPLRHGVRGVEEDVIRLLRAPALGDVGAQRSDPVYPKPDLAVRPALGRPEHALRGVAWKIRVAVYGEDARPLGVSALDSRISGVERDIPLRGVDPHFRFFKCAAARRGPLALAVRPAGVPAVSRRDGNYLAVAYHDVILRSVRARHSHSVAREVGRESQSHVEVRRDPCLLRGPDDPVAVPISLCKHLPALRVVGDLRRDVGDLRVHLEVERLPRALHISGIVHVEERDAVISRPVVSRHPARGGLTVEEPRLE